MAAKKRQGKRYTEKEKKDILTILEENKFNMAKTSHEVGISVNTIKNWMNVDTLETRIKKEIPLTVVKIIADIDETITEYYEQYVKDAFKVRNKVLNQINDNIESMTNPLQAASCLKIIDDSIINNIKVSNPEKATIENKSLSLIFNQIYPPDENKT